MEYFAPSSPPPGAAGANGDWPGECRGCADDGGPGRTAVEDASVDAATDGADASVAEPTSPWISEQALMAECGAAPQADEAFSRERLRAAAADCAMWHYCRFATAAENLDHRLEELSASAPPAATERAQAAWRQSMALWSTVELFQFGPLGSRATSASKDMYEGQGVRDLIYAWPTTSRCRVEEQLLNQNYTKRGLDGALISGRGLAALEYLLFYAGSDTDCAPVSSTAVGWSEVSASELAARKRDFAKAIGRDVVARVRALLLAWHSDGGDFRTTLIRAGGAYPDEQEVLKVIAWSLVYVEREVKDWKVGVPAGATLSHPVTVPESPYARMATTNIEYNLLGFRGLFQGCGEGGEGLGFDDWLVEVGHAELANDMVAALANALAVVRDTPELDVATAPELDALYQALRRLTALLKGEFFGAGSPLNLELPGGIEGDTD